MKERLLALKEEALRELEQASGAGQLNDMKIKYLGKKGPLTEILRGMGALSAEERRVIGQVANEVREAIEELLNRKMEAAQREETENRLRQESIDVTLPGRPKPSGSIHPITRVVQEVEDIFIGMGFTVAEG